MSNFLDKLKDLLYDSVDYIIMLGIVGLVVFIIGWRLDLLFATNMNDTLEKNNIVAENNTEDTPKSPNIESENDIENPDDSEEDLDESKTDEDQAVDSNSDDNSEDTTNPEENTVAEETHHITIPSGSSSESIGELLESKNLISSSSDFVAKAEELNLSTKLRSGEYEIKSNSSLEDIIKSITK